MNQDIGYAAGLLDGEGCISLNRHRSGGSVVYTPMVTIANANLECLQWLHARWGGTICRTHRAGWKDGRAECWRWTMSTAQLTPFLRDVLPALIVKRRQAILLLDFIVSRALTYPQAGQHGFQTLPEEEKKRREDCYWALRAAKKGA